MIRLDQVTKYYKSNDLIAVGIRKISLSFNIGEFVAITGESGSGKSTLLNILSGLDTFEEGEFYLFNEPTSHYTVEEWERYRAAYIGFVFQNYNIVDSYTVFQNVLIALEFQGYDEETRKARAKELIDKVGLSHRMHHKASKLSGGEKQRTVIARALAKDCPAILCDEPTGNLDSKTSEDILKLLHDISQDKLVIIVTHNYEEVEKYVDRQIKMSDGEIVEDIDLTQKNFDEEKEIDTRPKSIDFWTSMSIAFRNIFATPKRFVFFMLLQATFIFLVFLIYGTISSLAFQNQISPDAIFASEHQIVLQRKDYQAFSQDEIDRFGNMRLVQAVNDYETISSLFRSIDRHEILTERAIVLKKGQLFSGKFPESMHEVIVSRDLVLLLSIELGDEIILNTHNNDAYTFLVVGISDMVSKSVYFHESYFTNPAYIFQSIIQKTNFYIYDINAPIPATSEYRMIYIDETLDPGNIVADVYYAQPGTRTSDIAMFTGYGNRLDFEAEVRYIYSESSRWVYVSEDIYDALSEYFLRDEFKYRIVLNVHDQYDATRVIRQIDKDEYLIYYPVLTANSESSAFGILLRVASYAAILFVAMFLFMLLRFVFRNMVTTRRKDFAIFRSVGANKKFLGHLILLEQSIQIVIGTLITAIIVLILVLVNDRIETIMKFVNVIDMIVVLFIFSFMTIRTPLRYNKLIFEISVIDTLRSSTEVTSYD